MSFPSTSIANSTLLPLIIPSSSPPSSPSSILPPSHPFPISTPPSLPPCLLKVKLVPVSFEDAQFMASFDQSAALYTRYQMAVHGDAPSECGESEVQ